MNVHVFDESLTVDLDDLDLAANTYAELRRSGSTDPVDVWFSFGWGSVWPDGDVFVRGELAMVVEEPS